MKRLKASTLIEVIISMVIISIISSIAIMIYVNTITSLDNAKVSSLKWKAQYYVNRFEVSEDHMEDQLVDEFGDIIMIKAEPLAQFDHILKLRCVVADSTEYFKASSTRLIYYVKDE